MNKRIEYKKVNINKNIKRIIAILIIVAMLPITSVFAGRDVSVSLDKTTLKKGETTTLRLSASDVTGRFTLKPSSNIKLDKSSVFIRRNSPTTVKVTAVGEGSATITASGKELSDENGGDDLFDITKTVSLNIQAEKPPEPGKKPEPQPENKPEPKPESKPENKPAKKPSNQTPTAEDRKNLPTESKAQDRKEEKSQNNFLKDLSVSKGKLSPSFYRGTADYDLELTEEDLKDLKEITVKATAEDSKATIKGTGKIKVDDSLNTIIINVIAENGTQRNYNIKLKRPEISNKDYELTSLKVQTIDKDKQFKDVELNPKFDAKIREYSLDVTSDITELSVFAVAKDDDVIVDIIGNKELKEGENLIKIKLVKQGDDQNDLENMSVYTIKVMKNKKEEMQLVTDTKKNKKDFLKENMIFVILGLIILILLVVLILSIIRKKKKLKEAEKGIDLVDGENLDNSSELGNNQDNGQLDLNTLPEDSFNDGRKEIDFTKDPEDNSYIIGDEENLLSDSVVTNIVNTNQEVNKDYLIDEEDKIENDKINTEEKDELINDDDYDHEDDNYNQENHNKTNNNRKGKRFL